VNIVSISISASFVIMTAIILRALFIHQLPKKTFTLLWVVALCRLVIPVSVPSRLNILNLIDMLRFAFLKDAPVSGQTVFPGVIGNALPGLFSENFVDTALLETGLAGAQTANVTTAAEAAASSGLTILFWIWIAGVCTCALYLLITHFRCYNIYKTALPVGDNNVIKQWARTHPTRRKIRIRQSDRVSAPLTYGILRPVILLPRYVDSYDETNLTYILTHEYVHIRRFDTLMKWILAGALALHWFNPFVWIMYILANRDLELSCDESVVRMHGESNKSVYALTLLGLAEKRSGLLSLSSNFSKNAVEERVLSIMKIRKSSWLAVAAVVIAISCVTLVFGTTKAAQPLGADAEESGAASADVYSGAVVVKDFPGKVAIVTNGASQNDEEYRYAQELLTKYGADKIIHRTWPAAFTDEPEAMVSVLQEIAADPEVRALIINQAVENTNAAVQRFREVRDDVFVVYCAPAEDSKDAASLADLVFGTHETLAGEAIVMQAKALGADTIIHYSFPRHMRMPSLAAKREIIMETAQREGVRFIDITTPDPMDEGGVEAVAEFMRQDVAAQVELYGKNTAFFGTSCGMQTSLIAQVVATGAILPQPCCPSPYHGFPAAFGIVDRIYTGEFGEDGNEITHTRDIGELIADTRAAALAEGVSGRLSTWAVPAGMMWVTLGVEYAIEWINGNVPQQRGSIDIETLDRLAEDFTNRVIGEPSGASFERLESNEQTFNNFILMIVDFITY